LSQSETSTSADGVTFRRLTPADAAGVLAIHGDARVYEFDPDERHLDIAQSQRFLEPMVAHWSEHGFGYWAVTVPHTWWSTGPREVDSSTAVFAGIGGIQHHRVADRPVLNVYFRLAPEVQGLGLAGRILAAGVHLATERAPGTDVVVRTRPANVVARRVAERAGFTDEGLEPGDPNMQLLRLPSPRAS
jgi:RimJ/RimL family protein N-acetyltransferase